MTEKLWPHEIDGLNERQIKRIVVVDAEQYDPGFPPSRLADFLQWIADTVAQIPEQFRDTAEIEFSSTSSYYDSHYGSVEVSYWRPETDAEWEERKKSVAARRQAAEANERAVLAALSEKYGVRR